jgi:hypothetical protein
MFEQRYLTYLANTVCMSFIERCNKDMPQGVYDEALIVGRKIYIEPQFGVKIKLKFTAENYYKLILALSQDEEPAHDPQGLIKFIEEHEVKRWIMNTVEGKITKEKLDDTRQSEVNDNDMMQSTNITYHTESVQEMQLIGLIVAQTVLTLGSQRENGFPNADDIQKVQTSLQAIFSILFIEHIASYCIEIFRRYDIEKNGKIDINGVPRAKTESLLNTFQYFIVCFLIGYIIKELIAIDRTQLPIYESFALLWLIFDGCNMLLSRIYLSYAMVLKI